MNPEEPFGICICGYPSWLLTNGEPNHPCCAEHGPKCEPCRISRRWRKTGRP